MSRSRLPVVTVVGRPNVGKSTLFNRLVSRGDAVVDDRPGVTRDRREGEATWTGTAFSVVDTGGLVPGTRDAMEGAVLVQGREALGASDLIVFLVDAREGITAVDREIAEALRERADRILLVANKVEGPKQRELAMEAAELGFGTPLTISAEHGDGVGDLLDVILERLPRRSPETVPEDAVRVTLVGRPNVGKSSLANRLLGEERLIVHEEPGTTRDAVDVSFRYDGTAFVLVDTAGLRRRSHVEKGVEFYSTLRTRRSLERSDVALLVLDATQPTTAQDLRIAGEILDAGKSVILLVNKWDLLDKVTGTSDAFTRLLRDKFPALSGSPILYVSALTGQRVHKIPETARRLWEERRRRIPTSRLNEVLKEATERLHPPMKTGTKPLKLYYVTQTGSEPPVFTVFVNEPKAAAPSYRRYLWNFFRESLDLEATPVRMFFRARRK